MRLAGATTTDSARELEVSSFSTKSLSEKRIPVLDGLRGISILLVFWIHLMPDVAVPQRTLEWLRKTSTGGWIGVELFFVLSGFLITGILLDSKGSASYFRNFYVRRTLRIFPLYYLTLAVVFLLMPLLGAVSTGDAARMNQAEPWFWTYCANIGWMVQAPPRTPWPCPLFDLRHFWSLAVEEHFYFVWPLVVWLTSHRALKRVCAVGFALSLLSRVGIAFAFGGDSAGFQQTPCRFDALVTGAFVAVMARDGTWKAALPYAKWVAGILALPLLGFFIHKRGLWDGDVFIRTFGIASLSLIFGAALMMTVELRQGSAWASFFTNPVLRFFGKYSYGLYVIHGVMGNVFERALPLAWWQDNISSPAIVIMAVIAYKAAATTGLALLSWHLCEKHFLKLKSHFECKTQPSLAPLARVEQCA